MIRYFRNLCDKYMVLRYIISGGTAAATHLSLLYIFTEFLGVWYILSSILGFIFAVFVGFSLQKWWTFADKTTDLVHRQFIFYISITGANLFINAAILYFLVEYLGIWYIASQVITSGFLAIITFFIYGKFIFRRSPVFTRKLLVITQKVDKNDDILGVYHEWIKRLAGKVEKLNVICLYKGAMDLPANVQVYSLGKEEGKSRLKYVARFFKFILKLRKDYDKVFVHMNSEYVILGWKFWKLWGKKIVFWYNHPLGNWKARLAIRVSDTVLHTSPFAFSARYKKSKIMPVGIDTEKFKSPKVQRSKGSILYLGRLSPIKKIDVLLDAATILDKQDLDFNLSIIGDAEKPIEREYERELRKQADNLVGKGKVFFQPGIPNHDTPKIYNKHEIFVNLTPSGSFDKTIIEAMACETLTLASNKSVRDILPEEFIFEEGNAGELARKLKWALGLSQEEKQKYSQQMRTAAAKHDIHILIDKMFLAL